MVNTVDEYLANLKKEFRGSDPSLIQDALSDAEEYLRTALQNTFEKSPGLSEKEALKAIVEKYGNPEEVSHAYKEMEVRLSRSLSPTKAPGSESFWARFFGVMAEPHAWGAFLYTLFSVAIGCVFSAWALVGGIFSLFSLIFIIGIPITAFFLLTLRGLALLEGRIVEALLGIRMPRKVMFVDKDLKWKTKFKSLFTESHTWKTLIYMIFQFPLGLLYFGLIGGLFILSFLFISSPVMELFLKLPLELFGTDAFTPVWLLPFICVTGFFLLPSSLHLAKLLGKLHGKYAKVMLVRK
jgi:uncharacterized membrane protein